MELNDYLINVIPVNILELLAAIAGTYYLRRIPFHSTLTKYFVWYLWLTFFIEVFAAYAPIGYYSNYTYFSIVKDTHFYKTYWLYNPFYILTFAFYPIYFSTYLINKKLIVGIKIATIIYIVSAIISLFIGDTFFEEDSKFVNLAGSMLMFFSIASFYFDLLRSNLILNLKYFLPLYISIGLLIFYICVTPLSVLSRYFNAENGIFVRFQVLVVLISNILMYTTFIIGFMICSNKKKLS